MYERLRPLGYAQTNVILVCFAVNMPDSYERIRSIWVPEIQHYCPDAPLVVVGTKTDLREGSNSPLITSKEVRACQVASDKSFVKYRFKRFATKHRSFTQQCTLFT